MTEDVELNSYTWTDPTQSYETLVRKEKDNLDVDQGIKLGWIEGVLIPCLLSIWGVMLFLRIPWIVAQAGIFDSVMIIFISLIIITITTFSLSAISTNGRVKGGGLYFIISRSIGPELGSSIGILLALANAISVTLNTVGFCLSFRSLLQSFDVHALDTKFEFILAGFIAILIMGALCAAGMDDEAKVQNVLLVFIVVAILDVIIGSIIGPTTEDADASGFTGYKVKTFKENWESDYRRQDGIDHTFFTIFAVFFPSVTGIQAGANISGDLKDPSNAIPKGTLWSIIITITSYIVMVVVSGSVNVREASGYPNELHNGYYLNCTYRICSQGLYNNENLMQMISWSPYLIYLGCFAATLSTALTSLIAIPKILKRMGQDNIYPFLKYLVKGYGESNEPYRAHYLTVIVSSIFLLLMGELNTIASFISTIYLCAYALLNVCTFHVAHFKPLGWRPTYRFYNKWLSLAGAVICFVVMFLIDRTMSVIVWCVMSILYLAAAKRTHGINWGSSSQTQQIKTVIKHVYKANTIQHHVKNYVPNIMVLSGTPESRKELVYLAYLMTKTHGLQTCVNVERKELSLEQVRDARQKGAEWLNLVGVKSLYSVLDCVDLDVAVRLMIRSCGHGILKPNIVLVGYKDDWSSSAAEDVQTYLNTLHVANTNGLAALILRLPSTGTPNVNSIEDTGSTLEKNMQIRENDTERYRKIENGEESESIIKPLHFPVKINNDPFSFIKNRHSGVVDVWWMFDDGGLALTIAHIFKSSDAWKKCTFRIFGVANEFDNLDKEKIKLKQLLTMYRVRFDFIDVVSKHPTTSKTMANFIILWEQYRQGHSQSQNQNKIYDTKHVTDTLFIRDLLEKYSSDSDLIIMTSIFKIENKFDQIHMYWMEVVTKGLPPCILIQGNVIQTVTASA